MENLKIEKLYKMNLKENLTEYIKKGHSIIDKKNWSFFEEYIVNAASYSLEWGLIISNILTILKYLKEEKIKEAYFHYATIKDLLSDVEKNYIIYAILYFSKNADEFINELNNNFIKQPEKIYIKEDNIDFKFQK